VFVCVSLVMAGCFYVDPIEVHPHVALSPADGEYPLYRGSPFVVTAHLDHPYTFEWSAVACASKFGRDCSAVPFAALSGTSDTVAFTVPVQVGAPGSGLTQSIVVGVAAHDDRGALAIGAPTTIYAVTDAPPVFDLSSARQIYTIGVPLELFTEVGDPDDAVANLTLAWTVVGGDPAAPLTQLPAVPLDNGHLRTGVELTPMVAGAWDLRVQATDPLGATAIEDLAFDIALDRLPCIAQTQPIVAPDGRALPITEPTLFLVSQVDDDLDSYPRSSAAAPFGTATFAWSILAPGQTERAPLAGVTGNAVAFDPAMFTPGDLVELRVEVFDRTLTPVDCPDDQPTCAIARPTTCVQRQTWRVEVR
jgi:hypothetical protein